MKKYLRRKLNILLTISIIILLSTLLETSENSSGKNPGQFFGKIFANMSLITSGRNASAATNETVNTDTSDEDAANEEIANEETADAKIVADEVIAYGDSMSMSIDYGYDHYAKYGRDMSVSATITNNGEDFKGWLQVIVQKAENNVVYRKEIKITSLSTENISLTIPVVDDTGSLQVKLVDMEQNTIIEKNSKIKIANQEEQTYIGVLSDEREELDYLNTLPTKTFYLDESSLSDNYLGLDLLDILVINHYDTNRLSDKQLEAINKWVIQGGTLVIGTGKYFNETLAKLKDTYAITTSGAIGNYDITFGMNEELLQDLKQNILDYEEQRKLMVEVLKNRNETLLAYGKPPIVIENTMSEQWTQDRIDELEIVTVNKDIVEAHLEGGFTEVIEQNNKLMQIRPVENGTVQLFNFDMGLDAKSKSLGVAILDSITDNMSSSKQTQLQGEYYGIYASYGINSSMTYTDAKNVPKISGYIIILVIYILLVGPATYFILKKLDKRSLTWVTVPVLALVFTLLVYILGSDTRINEPYVGYVELLTFQENNSVKDEVYFGLTAPYNHKYTVKIDSKYAATELSNSSYNYYMNNTEIETDNDKYMSAINFGFDNTILEVNNNPAFSPVYYQTKSTYAMENQLTYDIHYLGENIYGTVTNGFDFDISSAILMSDGYMVHIGTIGQGETVSLEGKESLFLTTMDVFYNNDIINRVAGGTSEVKDNTAEMNRKANVLYYLGESKPLTNQSNSYVIGFMDQDKSVDQDNSIDKDASQNNLIDELSQEMDSYGTKVVMIPVQVDYTKENQTIVPSIDSYMEVTDSYYDAYYSYRYLDSDEKVVEYHLPEEDHIKSFEYLNTRNQDFEAEYQRSFEGKIYFLNKNTGNFDEVFQNGVGSSITDLTNYLTEQNTVTIRYSTNMSLQGYQMLLPYISYWKEAKSNAEN